MPYRTILIAAAFVAASPAVAQQIADPPPRSSPVIEAPADDEAVASLSSRDEVYVTGARQIPVQPVEGARSYAQRQRDRAQGRCVLQAQESADPTEPDLGMQEEVCRTP